MPTQTETQTKTIERRVTLSRTEQDCYYLTIELPEGVTAEQVDAELTTWDSKYAVHRSAYDWGSGEMACGAIVTKIDESCDDCPELDCAPIVRDEATGDLVAGSDQWPDDTLAARCVRPSPGVIEALALWVDHGAYRLEDTDWARVDLDDQSSWPSDEEIANGNYFFDREEVAQLVTAQRWLAAQLTEKN